MTHHHGVEITPDLPLQTVIDIRDGLKSGDIKLSFGAAVEMTADVVAWRGEHQKFMEGMSQRIVATMHYCNPDIVPLRFAGFASSYDTSSHVMDAGEPPGVSWATFFSESPA